MLFADVDSQEDRDARCAHAVRDHGYTMKAIAEFLGVHDASVSRALSRGGERRSASRVLDCKT